MKKPRRRREWYESDAFKVGAALVGVGLVGYLVFNATSARAEGADDEASPLPPDTTQPLSEFPLLAKLSAYWPATSEEEKAEEGPDFDRKEKALYSLQEYLAGNAPYVSVAADYSQFDYGEPISIKELDEKYNRSIDFRVVDSLHADWTRRGKGTGTRRLDIRVSSRQDGLDESLNSWVHYKRHKPPRGAVIAEVGRQ